MQFSEFPLLNTPNLTVILLRTAAAGQTTLDDAVERLRDSLRKAHENPPFDDKALGRRLRVVGTYLTEAGMLQFHSGDTLVITDRGLRALAACPTGFDPGDLVNDSDIRHRLRTVRRRELPSDPRNDRYADGYNAWRNGHRITDNPFRQDSVDHLALEDG